MSESPLLASPAGPERLPCGVSVDDLLEQVAQPSSAAAAPDRAHQENCPHCRAMLAELADLWAPVLQMAQDEIAPPESLSRTVMERVVAIASHGWHAVVLENRGVTRIAAWVVAVVARRAAAAVPGVATVRGLITPPAVVLENVQASFLDRRPDREQRDLASGIGVAGRKVVVQLTITAAADTPPLPLVVAQLRDAVRRQVRLLTGLDVVEIDVLVADVGEGPAPS